MGMIPAHFKTVHSLAHLVLTIGVFTSLMMSIDTLVNWYAYGCRTRFCQGRIIPLVFVSCCLTYFIRTAAQFDESLFTKQKELKKAKDELARRYHDTVAELDACVAKSMDTQATLAERSFDAKRRDFQRFLVKVAKDCNQPGLEEAVDDLVPEFRRFVGQWLQVFSECSMDPIATPLQIATPEELEQCGSVAEVAALVAERLKVAPVKFVSGRLDRDRERISGFRTVFHTLMRTHSANLASRKSTIYGVPDVESSPLLSGEWKDHRWLHLGKPSRSCGLDLEKADATGFPLELQCVCCSCVVLSREHLQLLAAIVLGAMVLYFEFFIVGPSELKWLLALNVILCMICIMFVLYEFADIDNVQQLETQLRDVEKEQARLEGKQKAMMDFYDRAQTLATVWLHRTVPRLELLKQLSEEVEDWIASRSLGGLKDMNASVAELERSLPELKLWLSDGALDKRAMERLGGALAALTQAADAKATSSMMRGAGGALARESERLLKGARAPERKAAKP